MLAFGQLARAMRGHIDLHDFAVHTQIGDGDDRLASGAGGVVDRVFEIRQQRLRRTASRRHDKDGRVVVRLEPLVGVGEEQDLAVVGRELRRRFPESRFAYGRALAPVTSITQTSPRKPSPTSGVGPRCIATFVPSRDSLVFEHRLSPVELCSIQSLPSLPELLGLVVLLERVDVIALPLTLAVVAGWRIAGEEIHRVAVRRPHRRQS